MKNIQSENKFVDKSNAHGLFNFDKDGTLRIAGVAAFMMPMTSLAIQYSLMSKHLEKKKLDDIIYYVAKIQGVVAVKILRDKFGIKSKKELFFTSLDQGSMIGLGKDEVIRFSEKDKHVILKKQVSPYEDAYTKTFGHQKEPIGHFFRGVLAGVLDELFEEPMVVIERQCKAAGNPFCTYEGFPVSSSGSRKITETEKHQIPAPETDFPEMENLKRAMGFLK